MTAQFIYTGPSWAESSYDKLGSWEDKNKINLAQQWQIPCINHSRGATSVMDRVDCIKQLNHNLPIIWIYNEPIKDITTVTGLSTTEFIQRSDWFDIWQECNYNCLKAINSLNQPVLLIGGHSDVIDCTHDNITVGHPSWQKWIAKQAGLLVDNDEICVTIDDRTKRLIKHCWGADVVHQLICRYSDTKPSYEIVDAVHDMFLLWEQLEKSNLFFEVHPNRQANQQFAEFLLPVVQNFLQETQ